MTALADADAAPATPQTVTRPTTLMLTVSDVGRDVSVRLSGAASTARVRFGVA